MKIRLLIVIFGFFATPTMASINKFVCPILPEKSEITWQEEHGIDTHDCTAIRIRDRKKLFSVSLGTHGWQGGDPSKAHKFKGVIAGRSILWHFYIEPGSSKVEWESIFDVPFKQGPRPLSVLVSVPQHSRPDTREALRVLSKMQLAFPIIGP